MKAYQKEQQKYRALTKPKFHVKGEKLTRMGWDADKKEYVEKPVVNDAGHHMVSTKSGFKDVNRRVAHSKQPALADGTGKKFTLKGAKHTVKPHGTKLEYDPKLTNKQRFELRKEQRNASKEEARASSGK